MPVIALVLLYSNTQLILGANFQTWISKVCPRFICAGIIIWSVWLQSFVCRHERGRKHKKWFPYAESNYRLTRTAQNQVGDQPKYVWKIHKGTYRDLQRLCIIYSSQIRNQIIERQLIVEQLLGNHVFHGGCHCWSPSIRRLGGVWPFCSIVNFSP